MSSLMSNFDTAREALETSLNASGSALAEHGKWSESLEAKLNSLSAAWQGLSQSFMNSDFLKGALDAIIALVEGLTKLIDTLGALPTLLGAFGTFKGISKILSTTSGLGGLKSLANILPILSVAFPNAAKGIGIFTTALKSGVGITGVLKAALSGLWTVVAAHPILAVVAAVGLAIVAFSKWHESASELAERIEEVTSEYKEQHNALMKLKGSYDTSNEDSMISKYEKLSKGVNSLGENVSLTADEYSEYQSIVDTIADQIPSLVAGYNSQGDAILSCAGSVDTLTEAYKNLIVVQNDKVLENGKDIFLDFQNDLEKSSMYGDAKASAGYLSELKRLMNLSDEELEDAITGNPYMLQISEALEKYDIKRDVLGSGEKGYETYSEHIIRAIKEDRAKVKTILDEASKDINAYAEDLGQVTEAYLSNAFLGDYSHMSDRMQNIISQVTSGFDSDFYAQFLDEDDPDKAYELFTNYFDSMLESFDSLSKKDVEKFEAAFDLQTKFNGGDISYGEYVKGLEDAGKLIDGLALDDEIKSQIKLSLGLDEDGFVEEYESLVNRLTDSNKYDFKVNEDQAKKFLDGLSAEELSIATEIIPELSENGVYETVEEIQSAINCEMAVRGLTFDLNLEVETAGIESLNTALQETVSGAGLSSESIAALKDRYSDFEAEGYDLSAMFEETSNGIHLNRKALRELEQAYAKQKQADITEQLGELETEYDNLTEDINNCTDASERAALYSQRDAIIQQINDAATLAAQYEGLTSAYNAWLAAEDAGQERDMYENMLEGFENIDDELSRGWLDDGTIEFLELLTGRTDLAGKSAKELKEIYDGLDENIKNTSYSIRDFFTVDEDGNSTSDGVYNFLDAIGQLEEEKFGGKDVIKRDDKGNIIGFDFELAGGDEAIAEALGISEELVQIMLRAADDAGFVVNLEGVYTQLADLKTEAETARQSLIDLQKAGKLKGVKLDDVNFNFDAEGDDLLAEQEKALNLLDKFRNKDGTINLEMEGAQEALDVAEYLTIKLDDLTEPKFMQIDTSEVDEDLRDPIEKIQEIGNLCKEKHLVTLTGDTEEIEEVQDKIDEVAKEIEELDPEVKAQIGIDENWTAEEIADKIEKGEIEIPAELELDVQMSDDLKDMRLMMMNQLGLVSDNEVKLKVGYDIDESIVDGLTDEEQEVVVKYLADHDEVDDYTPEQKDALVKYIADGGNLDKYTPKEKQSIVKYLADGGNIESYTPEEKQAIVEYLTDSGDPDSWTPEQKEAVAKFKKDSAEVDNYAPEDKQAIAKFIKDSIEPDTYQPSDKTAIATYKKNSSAVDDYQPADKEAKVTFWASIKKVGSDLWGWITGSSGSKRSVADGTANIDGTAFVDGTVRKSGRAFKQGDWGIKGSGIALMGELGPETIVRDGRFFTVGNNGAGFYQYKKGDIIFNHKQTEELFKNGKVTSGGGRGKSIVNGTAFAYGSNGSGGGISKSDTVVIETNSATVESKSTASSSSYGSSGSGGGITSSKKSYNAGTSSKNSKSSSSSSSTDDDFEETFDWIETAIDRLEREIDRLDTKANSTWRSWSERNKNLVNEISEVRKEIELQQSAYDRYMQEANSIGLSESWAKLVRDGAVDIDTLLGEGNEELADKIKEYQEW